MAEYQVELSSNTKFDPLGNPIYDEENQKTKTDQKPSHFKQKNSESVKSTKLTEENLTLFDEKINDIYQRHTVTVGKVRRSFEKRAMLFFHIFVSLFLSFLISSFLSDDCARRCLFISVFCGYAWIYEYVPPYVTALLLVPCIVSARCLKDAEGKIEDPSVAAVLISDAFFEPVILFYLSGFTLSRVLEKYYITRDVADWLERKFLDKTSERYQIEVARLYSAIAVLSSMFLSNITSAVLILPLVRQAMRHETSLNVYKRTLMMTVFALNIAGMGTPVATPHNIRAVSILKKQTGYVFPYFQWIFFALPFVMVSMAILENFMYWIYPDGYLLIDEEPAPLQVQTSALRNSQFDHRLSKIFIISIVALTIFFWIIFDTHLHFIFGHVGVVALFPIIVFHGAGILQPEDWDGIPWRVITLLGGCFSLGVAVDKSGLLKVLVESVKTLLNRLAVPNFVMISVFLLLAQYFAHFFRATVGGVTCVPLIISVGKEVGHYKLLTIGSAIMLSAGAGLPQSSFPNAYSSTLRFTNGKPIFTSRDYIKVGFLYGLILSGFMTIFGQTFMYILVW